MSIEPEIKQAPLVPVNASNLQGSTSESPIQGKTDVAPKAHMLCRSLAGGNKELETQCNSIMDGFAKLTNPNYKELRTTADNIGKLFGKSPDDIITLAESETVPTKAEEPAPEPEPTTPPAEPPETS